MLMDVLFVGAFIAVAVLTRPDGGDAGPRRCYGDDSLSISDIFRTPNNDSRDSACKLPWATFILAILST